TISSLTIRINCAIVMYNPDRWVPLTALAHRNDVLGEDHLFLADQRRVARRLQITREQPDPVGGVGDDLGNCAIRQRDLRARHQRTDVDRITHAGRLQSTPSPPPGAERAGVRWGFPERQRTPTSPSQRCALGPSLSPLK